MQNYWMVRAGEGGYLFDTFESADIVGIHFPLVGNVAGKNEGEIRAAVERAYPGSSPQKQGGIVGMHSKFCLTMQLGDGVATYDRGNTREYLLGTIAGECQYQEKEPGYRHFRTVRWGNKVPRDSLSGDVKNSLGGNNALFSIKPEHWEELMNPLVDGEFISNEEEDAAIETPGQDKQWEQEIFSAIEDEINGLSPRDMERLVASLLKAMGYNSTVTSQSGDGGYDVYASPDGLLFEEPRIRAEVKHRTGSKMDVSDIRRFASAKGGARGMYVSTGGYTKEAITEARGKDIIVLNSPQLTDMVIRFYDKFDMDGRMLLPMKKLYLPVKKK